VLPASRFVLPAFAFSLCAGPPSAIAQAAQHTTRVLLLYQQRPETEPMQEFTQALRKTVQQAAPPVEFYQEALDIERFAGRERSSALTEYFDDKYREFGIDVVVPVGNGALKFAVDQLAGVLPDVPIVFALGAAPGVDPSALPPNVTGRLSSASRFAPTLDMARSLQPDANRVVVVGGSGPLDSASVSAALAAIDSLRDSLQLTVLSGLSLDVLLQALRRLPQRSIVLFANYRQEPHGQLYEPADIIGSLSRAATAPMYVQIRHYIGEGAIGGSVIRFDDEGVATGRLIVRTLRRRLGDPMPPVEPIAKSLVADWRQLRRWGISEHRLPLGADVVYREPSAWQRYRRILLPTLGVISAQALLIGLLLLERRRRRQAQGFLLEEQRRAEEARLQVAHMSRLALVGELAATISHELRQPLAAIRANAEAGALLLAKTTPGPSEAREIFHNIVADDARAVDVIESVRSLLRKDESVLVTTFDLNQLCGQTVRLLEHDAASRNTRVELSLDSRPLMIRGDRVQLQQVVLNLVLNGLDAASTSTTDRFVIVQTESRADHVELVVRDSGPGLTPTVRPHLFEPFFSTKEAGLGLGLVIVRSIIARHSGQVRAENHPAGGAAFAIRLPRASAEQPAYAPDQSVMQGDLRDVNPSTRTELGRPADEEAVRLAP
jgi:signal transduction histidine kinase